MRKAWFSALNVLLSLIYYRGCKNLNGVLGGGGNMGGGLGGDTEEYTEEHNRTCHKLLPKPGQRRSKFFKSDV
jgi:hypothetical protein